MYSVKCIFYNMFFLLYSIFFALFLVETKLLMKMLALALMGTASFYAGVRHERYSGQQELLLKTLIFFYFRHLKKSLI